MGAFAERVTRRFRISPAELAFLDRLESRAIPVARGQLIARAGEPADSAFVLMTGWVMSYTQLADGSHQVRRLHFPGDLLAMPSIPMRHHAEDIEAISDAVVAPFPKILLTRLFRLPRLAAIMYMFAQAERITAGDRLASLGLNSAKGRVAFLLMDILHRLRSTDCSVTNSFTMHLSREQVAHVTGMTPVHASRMWSALLADRLISCAGRTVTIEDEDRLAQLGHYRDRGGDFDYEWLLAVRREEFAGAQARV
ncbi:MAG TPA: Crp/Fnr family transcriptional regulator [Sphingomicrobium sp.]|nr:Crp/Fnr family transcriptional regulator [Sphingomicrobium sp.]